ncbi:MAG TPA: hypothetical protein VG841_03025 [Caulobacterales bacterium]|nr:hypothetical protein [Caulobacterales bacterium]
MITGRRSSDWLRDASAQAGEGERRGADRRSADRRAPRRRIDPLFMATLVNQVSARETPVPFGYETAPMPMRRGLVVNLRA